jgi:hypothetical protein
MALRGVVRFSGSDGGEDAGADDLELENNEPSACAESAGPRSTAAAITKYVNKRLIFPAENIGSFAVGCRSLPGFLEMPILDSRHA